MVVGDEALRELGVLGGVVGGFCCVALLGFRLLLLLLGGWCWCVVFHLQGGFLAVVWDETCWEGREGVVLLLRAVGGFFWGGGGEGGFEGQQQHGVQVDGVCECGTWDSGSGDVCVCVSVVL